MVTIIHITTVHCSVHFLKMKMNTNMHVHVHIYMSNEVEILLYNTERHIEQAFVSYSIHMYNI